MIFEQTIRQNKTDLRFSRGYFFPRTRQTRVYD